MGSIIDQILDIALQRWTPGMMWDMGCRQGSVAKLLFREFGSL